MDTFEEQDFAPLLGCFEQIPNCLCAFNWDVHAWPIINVDHYVEDSMHF